MRGIRAAAAHDAVRGIWPMPAGASRAASGSRQLVLLICAALFINYVDRGNLATAAPLIQEQLHLSATELGTLLSAFYYSYVLMLAPVGWLGERFGAHKVLAIGVAIWSVATALTGFASSFGALLLLRLLLGVGESASFPCSAKLVAVAVEPARIGMANGLMAFGYSVGPALGTVLGGTLMSRFGWRPVFVLFGALSLLWLWPWRGVRVAEPAAHASHGAAAPSFARILRERALWGASLGHFASNYGFYFILAWLPLYLVKVRGFSMQSMAGIAGSAYLINAAAGLFAGWMIDAWIRSGRSASVIYKSTMALNHLTCIVAMIGIAVLPLAGSLACLFACEVVLGISSPGIYAIAQIMAGPSATGRWVGVQNCCGNIAGIVAPQLTGILVDATGSFTGAFILAALVNVLGLVGWIGILPRVAPLRWDADAPVSR
jgi:MFS family permease